MNKFILALALVLAPFFSVNADIFSDGTVDLKSPKTQYFTEFRCSVGPDIILKTVEGYYQPTIESRKALAPQCDEYAEPLHDAAIAGMTGVCDAGETTVGYYLDGYVRQFKTPIFQMGSFSCDRQIGFHKTNFQVTTSFEHSQNQICPPNAPYESYISSHHVNEEDIMCYDPSQLEEEEEECPTGFFKQKIRGECVPIDCPDEGVQDTIWGNGSVYTGESGTYCDGSCAFSASGGQNEAGYTGNIGLTVVSTGAQCGQELGASNGSNHDFYEGDFDSTCTSGLTSNGQPSVSCSNGDDPDEPDSPDTPEVPDEPIDLTDEQDNEIGEITAVSENCDVMDTACEMRNIQEKLDSENKELKTEQQEQHNKLIKAQEKSTNELVKAINGFREGNNVGQQNIQKAIENGGTGSGGGVGGGTGGDEDGEGTEKTRNTEPSEGLEGFYESEYEDGFEGMFNEKMAEYKETEFFAFLEQFKPSFGGSAPNMSFCMNFGSYMNLGCFSLELDPRLFPALKIFILITAAFTCRKIIFGG